VARVSTTSTFISVEKPFLRKSNNIHNSPDLVIRPVPVDIGDIPTVGYGSD